MSYIIIVIGTVVNTIVRYTGAQMVLVGVVCTTNAFIIGDHLNCNSTISRISHVMIYSKPQICCLYDILIN